NAGYDAIKSVLPGAFVMNGGLSQYGQYGSKSSDGTHWDMQLFAETAIPLGWKFDALATHPYFFGDNDSATQMLDLTNVYGGLAQSLTLPHSIKATLAAHGIDKPIWFTEVGAPTDGSGWTGGISEATQASYLQGLFSIVKQHPEVGDLYWYSLWDRASNS